MLRLLMPMLLRPRCFMAKKNPSLAVGRGEKLPVSQGAGLTAKGRAKYNKATGSNLKAPAPNPKTKADEGRRKSFCAHVKGAVLVTKPAPEPLPITSACPKLAVYTVAGTTYSEPVSS